MLVFLCFMVYNSMRNRVSLEWEKISRSTTTNFHSTVLALICVLVVDLVVSFSKAGLAGLESVALFPVYFHASTPVRSLQLYGWFSALVLHLFGISLLTCFFIMASFWSIWWFKTRIAVNSAAALALLLQRKVDLVMIQFIKVLYWTIITLNKRKDMRTS